MMNISEIADKADVIINGYAFTVEKDIVRVLNLRTCSHRNGAWIFEQIFVEDKAKFRRLAVASQEILTQSSAKFAEKTRANSYENRFLTIPKSRR